MISNQILQSTIDGLKGITKRDITVMDVEGSVLATTEDIELAMDPSRIHVLTRKRNSPSPTEK